MSGHAAWLAKLAREERRFHIIMGLVFGLFLLLLGLFGWWAVTTAPQRRAAYMADCEGKGFNAEQCRFLYAERMRQDGDAAVALSLSASALAITASRR
jgi:hypothetical protein